MDGPIRVLVVDDSLVMRKILTDLFQEDRGIVVVGTARNGKEALLKIRELSPDVVTMDIEMPEMDGITALKHIMRDMPCPVIMISSADKKQADITMKALELGAIDFIPKTSGSLSLDIEKVAKTIIEKIKVASKVKVKASAPVHNIMDHHLRGLKGDRLVLIGCSTGGPKALPEVLSRLPGDIPAAVLVVQHMPEGFTKSFAERLNWSTSLSVKEAEEGDELKRGHVLIAPGNRHMEVVGNHVHLNDDPKIHFVRPAVDVMMKTAVPIYGKKIVGVVLTGMGYDGAEGMKMIKEFGGRTIVQDEATCVVYGMPKAVVDSNAADMVVPLEDIADHIMIALKD